MADDQDKDYTPPSGAEYERRMHEGGDGATPAEAGEVAGAPATPSGGAPGAALGRAGGIRQVSPVRPPGPPQRRHAFARITHADGRRGFAKVAFGAVHRAALRYESDAARAALALGYPSVPILAPYAERGGVGVLEYEYVGSREALATPNTLAARRRLPARCGRLVAALVAARYGAPVPERAGSAGAPFAVLRAPESYAASPETLVAEVVHEQEVVLAPRHRALVGALVHAPAGGGGAAVLRRLFAEVREVLPSLLASDSRAADGQRYFAVNDLAPHNLFFPFLRGGVRRRPPVLLFDWESAGVVSAPAAAALLDWGNFYARCDPNAAVQDAFAAELLAYDPLGCRAASHALLRCAVIARTTFAAHLHLAPESPRHDRAASLLRHLRPALARIAGLARGAGRQGHHR